MYFYQWYFSGLYGILKEKPKREYLLILGSVGLVLTHSVIALYTAILCFIYLIVQCKTLKKKQVRKKIFISIFFILVLSSFFWAPLLEHKLATKYEVFKSGRMERTEVLVALKLDFFELFFTPKENIRIYEIGLLSTILLIMTPVALKKLKEKWKNTDFYRFYIFSLIVGIVSCIMTLKIFPFELLPSILKMLQFSFRMLEFSSFFLAFVVAVNIAMLVKKMKYRDIIVFLIILMLLSTILIPHLQYTNNLDEERLWPAVPVTENTGRVHAGCASFEYLPSKAFENRSYIETRKDEIIIIEGNVEISEYKKENTNLYCVLKNGEEQTKLELPYIYYLGYEVTIEQSGNIEKLETYETENGFIGVSIPSLEEGSLKVHYEGTVLMKISSIISVLGVIGLFISFKNLKETKKQRKN